MPACKFIKKIFIFQNASRLFLQKRLWSCESTIYFRKYNGKVVLLVIYLFNKDSSKSIFFMLNIAFDVVLSTVFLSLSCQINWISLFLAIQRLQQHPSFCWACVFWYQLFYKNLIVLRHGANNFPNYFNIWIKFKLLTTISTMKKR